MKSDRKIIYNNPQTIGILTIATNQYIVYWQNLVRSYDPTFSTNFKLTFHVFTDQVDIAQNFAKRFPIYNIEVHEIEHLDWPQATLLRYFIISKFKDHFTESILMHVDADSLFTSNFSKIYDNLNPIIDIVFVCHPGYFRTGSYIQSMKNFSLRYFLQDLKLLFTVGGLGAWETRPKSKAFVPRNKRISYYCGAVWFGPKDKILNFCSVLQLRVAEDLTSGIIAKWHDESHLNWFAAYHQHEYTGPEFCYDNVYPNLRDITPAILALRK